MCLLQILVDGGEGVEISFGVLGSSLPDLEDEGLECEVSFLEASYLGQ